MSVEKKIKIYLVANDITQKELSNKIGIALTKVNLSLNGHRQLSLEEYELICGALDVPITQFLEAQKCKHSSQV